MTLRLTRTQLTLFVALVCCSFSSAAQCPGEPLPSQWGEIYWWGSDPCTYYDEHPHVLVFSDEFNGNDLDHTKWATYFPYTSDGSDQCQYCRTHGDEHQVYLDNNVTVSDGLLHLTARYQPTNWMGAERDYTSGMIYSKTPWKFRRGRFEISCRIPRSNVVGTTFGIPYGDADGLWPAFWLHGGPPPELGTNLETEIDIMEICGNSQDEWFGTLHRKYGECPYHAYGGRDQPLYDFADGNFHTFACEWDHWFISFIVDGVHRWRYPHMQNMGGNWITNCGALGQGTYMLNPRYPDPNAFLNVIANLAIQKEDAEFCGSFALMDHESFPKVMDIDYIRVWQREPWVQVFPEGCRYYEQHQNETFTATHKQQATEWIAAGKDLTQDPQGPVTINSGSDVLFRGGWSVDLRPGFVAEYGSTFLAEIGECVLPRAPEMAEDHMQGIDVRSRVEKSAPTFPIPKFISKLEVHPNPSMSAQVMVTFGDQIGDLRNSYITVSAIDGMVRLSFPFDGQELIDITSLEPGAYVLRLCSSNHNVIGTTKVIVL